ncbi:oxidoreductase [Capsulimonas corticalis]|uniref:Oxidoreductase n=1 Tax=Capsulimonas corticalis TaxID=2219043 RepID=A0A402D0T5_9BACT|nr:aldo/keto reductase [Capsulimonas corticalis]BDI33504.1 oxidoreductase [Capsulimonas corticalis]
MKYKLLGRSGLRVSEICLGTMTFGEDWGWGASKDESQAVFDAFVSAGGNFIDTANLYTNGSSEKITGELIAHDRDRFVLATKFSLQDTPGAPANAGNPNAAGNHRKNLRRSVEGSLKRLGTDYIDLLWLHAWDFTTPVEEVMQSLDDLVRAGKVNYVGVSDTPAWIVSQANTLAELRGWSPFVALQIEYSLIERTPERDLIPMANALGLSVTPWSPLGMGVLTGKYNDSTQQAGTRLGAADGNFGDNQFASILSERNLAIARTVSDVAAEIGKTPSQVALAWLLAQGPSVIPIIGTRKVHQLVDNLGSVDITLTADQLATLDAASKIELGFPHDMIASPMVRSFVTAGNDDAIVKR